MYMFWLFIFLLILCIYICAKTGNLTILFAGVLTGIVVTSICSVAACILADKFLMTGGGFMSFQWSWYLIALFTAIYAIPFGIVTSILLTTANVIWRLNFLQSVGSVTGLGLIIGLLCWLSWNILKEGVPFFISAIVVTTIINSATISVITGWLQQPLK